MVDANIPDELQIMADVFPIDRVNRARDRLHKYCLGGGTGFMQTSLSRL